MEYRYLGRTGLKVSPLCLGTMDQLAGSVRATEIVFTTEQLKTLDDIWPGPGGPAPEAYAW